MAAAAATASMIGVIPVVTTAGIAWKMTQAMMPGPGRAQPARRRRRKKDVYDRNDSGNFSNLGY